MVKVPWIIPMFFIFLSSFMSGVSLFYRKRVKTKLAFFFFWFWVSSAFYGLGLYFMKGDNFLSTLPLVLGQILLSLIHFFILGELCGKSSFTKNLLFKIPLTKSPLIFIPTGVMGSLLLTLSGVSFPLTFIPFSLSLGGVGVWGVLRARKNLMKNFWNSLLVFSVGLFYILKILFPFSLLHPQAKELWEISELITLFLQLIITFPVILSAFYEEEKKNWENVLKDRSEKFIGQSKFSELGMLSAGITHEINNPLTVILARTSKLLQVSQKLDKGEELSSGLGQIYRSAERISHTIQGVRDFIHHGENGQLEEVEVKELLDSVLSFCGQRLKNHGISLRAYGLDHVVIRGNKIQLEQVLLNLFNNSFDAIEFLPDKWIEVSCHQREDKVQIFFKDSGHGIPEEISAHMMEPFFSTKKEGKGTGLGLSLSQGILLKHQGSLKYLSERPFTTFLLELPGLMDEVREHPIH